MATIARLLYQITGEEETEGGGAPLTRPVLNIEYGAGCEKGGGATLSRLHHELEGGEGVGGSTISRLLHEMEGGTAAGGCGAAIPSLFLFSAVETR